jgi:hypothetical protein
MWYQGFFNVHEHHGGGRLIVEIKGHTVRSPHTLQFRTVTSTEANWLAFFLILVCEAI